MEITRVAWTHARFDQLADRAGYVPQAVHNPEPEMFRDDAVDEQGPYLDFTSEWEQWSEEFPTEADELAEAAGRLCYKSWNRPNPVTADTQGYVNNIIQQRHYSVLEHASVTYYVRGVSRCLLTELERHRHLSYSVVSQRYVDHSDAKAVIHPAIEALPTDVRDALVQEITNHQYASQQLYSHISSVLEEHDVRLKTRRGAARMVLPEGTETELLVTGNLRAWREVADKRVSVHAEDEIRQLAKLILEDLIDYAPSTFQDFW